MNFLLLLLLMNDPTISLTSTAFKDQGDIPAKYSCEGQSINPPLEISQVPAGTKSLALIVDDPDGDKGVITHWITWNISPTTTSIAENSKPGMEGKNEKGESKYMGPCPPTGKHHYYFHIYALDKKLELKNTASKKDLEDAMNGHILAAGQLVGMYQKTK